MKRSDDASKSIKAAIAAEPELAAAYRTGLSLWLTTHNFDDVVMCLDVLEEKFDMEWNDLRDGPEFADFVESPQYAKWMENRKK